MPRPDAFDDELERLEREEAAFADRIELEGLDAVLDDLGPCVCPPPGGGCWQDPYRPCPREDLCEEAARRRARPT